MGSEARARLGLLGVGLATLLTFNQLFGQQEFAGPSLLAMMVATGIALGCRRLGLSGVATLIVSALALTWYVTLIFQAPHTFWGLPTFEALERLGRSISRAYEHSTVDYAPVPLRPGYAILTVIAMWTLIALGEVATFRWRRPLVASLPPVALFSFLLVVGTRDGATVNVVIFLAAMLTFWSLEATHRLRSWGRWVPVWRGQRVEEPAPITTALARRMGVACVCAALVVPIFIPSIEEGLISWRNKSADGLGQGGGGPFPGSGSVDPLVSMVPRLITQSDQELFTVDSDEASYWRLYTLINFNGQNWYDGSPVAENIGENGLVPMYVPEPKPGRGVSARFQLTGLSSVGVPGLGSPITVQPEVAVPMSVDPLTGDLKTEVEVSDGFAYSINAVVPDVTFKNLRRTPVGEQPNDDYYAHPQLSREVADLVEDWTAGAKTDFQKLIQIQDRLRGFDYSLDVDQPVSADYIEEFLLTTRVGYCQQFATAFAVIARHLGYPSRVQVGFLPGSTDVSAPDRYVVRGSDTHAWPEVYFEGLGWVPFEPTPRDGTAPPAHTVRPTTGSIPANPAAADNIFTGGENKRGFQDIGGVRDNPRGRTDGRPDAAVPQSGRRTRVDGKWEETFARILVALLLVALLFIGSVPAVKRWRVQRRYSRAADDRAKAAAAFAEFQWEASELASPRKRAESASAYAQRIGNAVAATRAPALRLASIYERAEFAPTAPSPQLAEEAKRLARQLKKALWSQASWWQRMKRLLSPAGLIHGPSLSFRRVALHKLVSLGRS